MFQGCFTEDSRVFQGSFKGVSRMFQGCFKKVLRVFHENFKGVSRKFQGCFKEVPRKGVSRKVSCCMALIAASRAEGGLVFLAAGENIKCLTV